MSAQKITINGFLNEFKRRHDQMQDRPFCWILGSGASVQSGIPTGKTLSNLWLNELHELEDFQGKSIDEWASAETLGIKAFEYAQAADFYPWIYQRRFRDYKEQGYAFLENVMDHAEPSFGYSVLAQIMALTPHKVAITTNFDNLMADALSIYTRIFPLVCGHESLTGYIRSTLRRPLIAKIHRDLLLAPLSNPDEIAKLPGEWAAALTKIFDRFTPIVIGYGGNDGTLMGFLGSLEPVEGGMFWCYREGDEIDSKIQEVVQHHHGRLVPVAGFDEVMLQLQEKLQLPFLLPILQSVHEKRVAEYQKQFEDLTTKLRAPAENPAVEEARKPARDAAETAVERLTKEKSWWGWQLKADAESNPAKKELIYKEGMAEFPESSRLISSFALFKYHMQQYKQAERLYGRALDIDPRDAVITANLALLIHQVRKDYFKAEQLYRKALRLDPSHAVCTANLGLLIYQAYGNHEEAERLYRRALEIDPNDGRLAGNFAQFLAASNRFDEAKELSLLAWRLLRGWPGSHSARVAFIRWLLDRVAGGPGLDSLGQLKTILDGGFRRDIWSFDDLLAAVTPHLADNDQALARKLSDAILDQKKTVALNRNETWEAVPARSVDLTA
jgi:tetratricopeptide (TPR) repeat protein